ncbi:hypothetical protein [Embleya sp. NPDC001921]
MTSVFCAREARADVDLGMSGYRKDFSGCIIVPQDLQGVVFGVFCKGGAGVERFRVSRDTSYDIIEPAFNCDQYLPVIVFWKEQPGGKYQNIDDAKSQQRLRNCYWDEGRYQMGSWLAEHRRNGGPDTRTITQNPCDSLPDLNRSLCPDVRDSKFSDQQTHPCNHRLPGTRTPVLEPAEQTSCKLANPWFQTLGGGRGDPRTHNRDDYSSKPEVTGPLMEGLGWVLWAGTLGCLVAAFSCIAQLAIAHRNGSEVVGGVIYVFVGALLVGGSASIVNFLLIG